MIADLLKYAKKNPTSVIVGLLAIIAAGGIAGGLWIQNLRSAIDERDKIIAERLKLVQERNRQDLRTLEQANVVLRQQAEIIAQSSADLSARLKAVGDVLNELRAKGAVAAETATKLEAATQSVTQQAESLAGALARVQDLARFMDATRPPHPMPPSLEYRTSAPFFLILVVVAAIVLYGFYAFRRAGRLP